MDRKRTEYIASLPHGDSVIATAPGEKYGARLKLQTHAVVCIDLARLVWERRIAGGCHTRFHQV